MIWILLAAGMFKIACLLSYVENSPFFAQPMMDDAVYVDWALRINEEGWLGREIFYRAPLYPYLVSVVFKFCQNSLTGVYLFQVALGLSMLALVYLIGRDIFSERAGLAAALLCLMYAPLTFFEMKILPTVPGLWLATAAVYLFTRAEKTRRWAWAFAGSAFLGLAVLCLPQYILVAPLALAAVILRYLLPPCPPEADPSFGGRGRRAWGAAVCALLLFLPVAVVTARNYIVGKDFVLISANAGLTFAQGNNTNSMGIMAGFPGFSGSAVRQEEEERKVLEEVFGRKVGHSEANRYWFGKGLDFIRAEPMRYLKTLGAKMLLTVNSQEVPDNYSVDIEKELCPTLGLAFLPFGVVMAFASAGMVIFFRARLPGLVLVSCFFAGLFSLLIFYVSSRYRMCLVPPALVMAGGGADAILGRLSDFKKNMQLALTVTAVFVLSLPPFSPIAPTVLAKGFARLWMTVGDAYSIGRRIDRANMAYERAGRLNPNIRAPKWVQAPSKDQP